MKTSRCRLADYVKTLHQISCRTCRTIIFLHSTNQVIDLWRCCWCCHRQILNSLMKVSRRHQSAPNSVPHVQHDYFSSSNQWNHWFVTYSLPLLSSLGSLRFDDGNVNDNATNQWFHWLNEEKWSCCTCGTLFGAMFWRSLPNDDVKFSYLWFWRQRELAAVNLSFFAFTWKPFVPNKRKCTQPILYDVVNME